MKLTYLGTAAAEGLPAVWCNCPVCRAVREKGGKNVRTRSQILIDDGVLFDFPMDTYMHVLQNRFDLSAIHAVLISHAHMDHCYPQEFTLHGAPFAHGMTTPTVTVYGNETVCAAFRQATAPELRADIAPSVPVTTVQPYQTFVTAGGYRLTPLPAIHTQGEQCLIYAVSHGGKTVLLFNDSGILPNEEYDRMADMGLQFDLVSFDCTYGHARHGAGRHMGALDASDERNKMEAHGLVHGHTQYVLTHFSHNGALMYDEQAQKAKELGFTVAYDGMQIDI